jgi:hypothetical protein
VGNLLTEVALSNLLHLAENHSRNLLRSELLLGTIDLDLNNGTVITVDNLEGEVLDIALEGLLGVLAANETPGWWLANCLAGRRISVYILDIVDSVLGVCGGLVLGGVSNETLLLGEGDVGRSDSVTLIVDENLDLALLHHTDTAVCGSKILWRVSGVVS